MVMIRYLMVLTLLLVGLSPTWAQSSLKGVVTDEADGNAGVAFASVLLKKDGEMVSGTATDLDGNYNLSNLSAGTYDLVVSYTGYPTLTFKGIQINSGSAKTYNVVFPKMNPDDINKLEEITVEADRPIVDQSNSSNSRTITSEEIEKLATRNIASIAAQKTGVIQKDEGEAVSSSGSRPTSNDVYVDGVRQFGDAAIPETEIEQVQVITSGIPAEFGDVTGAITNIVTKGPSNKFTGGAQVETSQFLDAFGANRADLSFAGPILKTAIKDADGMPIMEDAKDKDGKTIMVDVKDADGNVIMVDGEPKKTAKKVAKTRTLLGYRVAATYSTSLDERASALGSFKLKDDVLERIKANPLVNNPEGAGRVLAADFLTADDLEVTKIRPNSRESYSILNAKLDYKPTTDLYVSAGVQAQFNWGNSAGVTNRIFNYEFNPIYRTNTIRSFVRLRQTIASTTVQANAERDSTTKVPTLQNLSYELQLDYTTNSSSQSDPRYGQNLFEYGYVGKIFRNLTPVVFEVDSVAIYNSQDSLLGYDVRLGHGANFTQFTGFEANRDINPGLSAYNDLVDQSSITSMEELEIVNGRFTGNRTSVYGLFNNVHANGSGYGKSTSSQLRANVKVNFDLVQTTKDKSQIRHYIQLGGTYEQRVDRSYSISPFSLWTLADQSANDHLSFSADRSRPTGETFYDPNSQRYFERYENLIRNDEEGNPTRMNAFGERLRADLGLGERDWVNVHQLTPDQLRLDMFEPTTLIQGRNAVMNYAGFDYLGNALGSSVQFNDFFSEVDADGRKTRPIAPIQPIYIAGYIQDKFTYKDIIVRAGVRFDSYDANTKVLRDPYSISGFYTASEFENTSSGYSAPRDAEYNRPSSIGDDYVVYVNENSPDASVVGYRQGEQWYNAAGSPVNNAGELGSNFIPALRGFSSAENDPQGENYNPDQAFRDYTPNLIIMPRLSFSFPIIKDVSSFYANYDVLAQRPPTATVATPLTYYNFRENAANGAIANPNLQSQRVVNYEVGYEQALNKFSRFKFAMLYREERNLIQLKQYFFAYPVQYSSFGNDDFSTTKSFMFEYELRPKKRNAEQKAGNMRIIINYTLQFAEGTGSSPTSSAAIAATDLKYIFPLDYDQRHTFFVNWDYRYKSGNDYNGPRIGKFDVLANTGLNVGLTAFSGSPYTRKLNPGGIGTSFNAGVTEGSINGARLPWSYRLDVRLDRDIKIGGKEKGDGKSKSTKAYNVNVYVRVQNLLNTQNLLAVYPATGSPVDDGFLTLQNSPGLGLLDLYPESFSLLYDLRMNNPFNISRPRRIFLGAIFQF